jgi:EAL domain-containing protein (putative c-di-GMP-specific phosphodiesterase class I)
MFRTTVVLAFSVSATTCLQAALLRWQRGDRPPLGPNIFIPVAEDSGLINPLGQWVLRQAVQQAALWRDKGYRLLISVNVSALQFQQPDFVQSVATALAEFALEPQCLELELTESILIQDAQEAMQRLQGLSELGVKLAIDDFGTGHSSLVYLQQFHVDYLKIDQSFIGRIGTESLSQHIVDNVIDLGARLGLSLVAEGVETEQQAAYLQDKGVDYLQGYLFSRPVPLNAFLDLLP